MNNMLRVMFQRGEGTKFVSHLDLMKTFDRSIRRAGLPIFYSQGFNPHPSMVFGLPLSVGITSQAEYIDIELTEKIEIDEFLRRINESLPRDLKCMEAKYFTNKGNIMKEVTNASYDMLVSFDGNISIRELEDCLNKLKNSTEIVVQKEGKNGLKDVDIKPMIWEISACLPNSKETCKELFNQDTKLLNICGEYVLNYLEDVLKSGWKISYDPKNIILFSILCSAGSRANMKPELLHSAMQEILKKELRVIKIHRTGLFVEKNGEILSPFENLA